MQAIQRFFLQNRTPFFNSKPCITALLSAGLIDCIMEVVVVAHRLAAWDIVQLLQVWGDSWFSQSVSCWLSHNVICWLKVSPPLLEWNLISLEWQVSHGAFGTSTWCADLLARWTNEMGSMVHQEDSIRKLNLSGSYMALSLQLHVSLLSMCVALHVSCLIARNVLCACIACLRLQSGQLHSPGSLYASVM